MNLAILPTHAPAPSIVVGLLDPIAIVWRGFDCLIEIREISAHVGKIAMDDDIVFIATCRRGSFSDKRCE